VPRANKGKHTGKHDKTTVLTILSLGRITGTMGIVVVVARVDGTMEVEILATGITDTVIGTWEDKMEEIKVAEVTEDVEETMTIGCNKATICPIAHDFS
jgi:hypothetical protein